MQTVSKEIITEAAHWVGELLKKDLPPGLHFHDPEHTEEVREVSALLAEDEDLSDLEKQQLALAAIFHDVGYTRKFAGHEEVSAEMAQEFLMNRGVDQEFIDIVKETIFGTKLGFELKSQLQKIICDADLAHLGSKDFDQYNEKLRQELERTRSMVMTDTEWYKFNLKFLQSHHYKTESGIKRYSKQKMENMSELEEKLQANGDDPSPEKKPVKKKKKDKSKKKPKSFRRPEKGIETMFRVAFRNHVNLSQLADSKAGIMLSINGIIITVLLGTIFSKLDTNPHLLMPTFLLLATCLLAILMATLATLPNITRGKVSREEILGKRANLLFFGNFHKMELDDYLWGMGIMMEDGDYLYDSMIKDLFFLGKVLNRKYIFLRATFIVFAVGITISAIAFVIAFLTLENPVTNGAAQVL